MEMNRIQSYGTESATTKKVETSNKTTGVTSDTKETKTDRTQTQAVVVEKTEEEKKATYTKNSGKVDTATIEKLKQEAEEKTQQLRTLVEKLLLKQSGKFEASMDVYDIVRSGKLEVDEETRQEAAKEVAEDGYWGVEQTSERLFSFAKALAGDDPANADRMVEAFKKGYEAAEEKWGGELPEICQKTYDAFLQKIEDWKNPKSESEIETSN